MIFSKIVVISVWSIRSDVVILLLDSSNVLMRAIAALVNVIFEIVVVQLDACGNVDLRFEYLES